MVAFRPFDPSDLYRLLDVTNIQRKPLPPLGPATPLMNALVMGVGTNAYLPQPVDPEVGIVIESNGNIITGNSTKPNESYPKSGNTFLVHNDSDSYTYIQLPFGPFSECRLWIQPWDTVELPVSNNPVKNDWDYSVYKGGYGGGPKIIVDGP
jgi:hypothetical protein